MALLEDTIHDHGIFVVPPHFFAEIINVLYQRVKSPRVELRLTPSEAEDALGILSLLKIEAATPPGLYERALRLADRLTLPRTYDALYLVVADLAECEFWTGDGRLVRALDGRLPYVHQIADYARSQS